MSITGTWAPDPDPGAAPASARCAGFLLAQLGRLAQREWSAFLARADVTHTEYAMLAALHDAGTLRQRDLAALVAVDPRNAVSTVASLARRGLIAAATDPADRRGKHVRLTPAGEEQVTRLTRDLSVQGTAFFRVLSSEDYEHLRRSLSALYEAHISVIDGTSPQKTP